MNVVTGGDDAWLLDIPTGAPVLICIEGDIYAPPVNKNNVDVFFQRLSLGVQVFQAAHGLWITGKDGRMVRILDFVEHEKEAISFHASYLHKDACEVVNLPKGKYVRQVFDLRKLRNDGIQNLLMFLTALELPCMRKDLRLQ